MTGSGHSIWTQPGWGEGWTGRSGDEGDAAADFGKDLLVAGGVGGDGGGGSGKEEFAFVRGAAGHGEVAEGGPDFVPGDLAVGGELEAGGAQWRRAGRIRSSRGRWRGGWF
jgi:hypothetical protein